MRTPLDELAKLCVLESIIYDGDVLELMVVELTAGQPEAIGGSWEGDADLPPAERIQRDLQRRTAPTSFDARSRRVAVRFQQPVAWQTMDEIYHSSNEYDQCDSTDRLRVLQKSRYLDYMRSNHGFFETWRGPSMHYQLCTVSDIVDVISPTPPVVEPVTAV